MRRLSGFVLVFLILCWGSFALAEGEADKAFVPPASNTPGLKAPPSVPEAAKSEERARLFVKAIRENNPEIARPFFFPQEAFRHVKAIKNPDRYFERLMKVYLEDVATMRKGLKDPDSVEFVSFSLGRQKRWMARGKEGNDLPYWAMYKARITVKDKGKEKVLPMRVMITWDDQWYVTHLTRK